MASSNAVTVTSSLHTESLLMNAAMCGVDRQSYRFCNLNGVLW